MYINEAQSLEFWDRPEVDEYYQELSKLINGLPPEIISQIMELTARFHIWIEDEIV